MVRATGGKVTRHRRKKVLARAKGFRGSLSRLYRPAHQAVTKALAHAFRGRRLKKRDFRSLWTVRLNAASREHGLSYSRFISGLKRAGVALNRKVLAQLAREDQQAFAELVEVAKSPP